jgi:hypothetical protein
MKTYSNYLAEVSSAQALKNATRAATPNKRQEDILSARRKARTEGKPTPQSTTTTKPNTTTTAIVKAQPKSLPSDKGSAIQKRPSTAITPRPAAQQTSTGGALVKARSNKLANSGIKKVDVKVDEPRPQRPGTTRPDTKPETATDKPPKPDKPDKPDKPQKPKRDACPAGQFYFAGQCRFKGSPLQTDDSASTGSVGGVKMKNTIDS